MPVMNKEKSINISKELHRRFENLIYLVAGRELSHPREGAGNARWANPDAMCSTVGTTYELSLAIEDFKSILAEIKKLK